MKRLKQHDNPLAVYPLILERLKTVPGVKAVKEVGELAELLSTASARRKAAPLDGAVYVAYGGSRPEGSAGNGRMTTERLYFTFVLAKSYAGARGGLYEVGAVLAAIQHSFGGWDAGAEYTISPFVRTAGPAIEYNDGYAFYPKNKTSMQKYGKGVENDLDAYAKTVEKAKKCPKQR